MKKRKLAPIGAGSMADVAFLLLVFFLVATTIQTDSGLNTILPPWSDKDRFIYENRNVFSVQINAKNQLLVEGLEAEVSNLKTMAEEHVLRQATSPKKAIVSIQTDKGASYETYIAVFNAIKAGYNTLWENTALERYGQHYKDLKEEVKRTIRKEFPFVLSEMQTSDFGL